MGGASGGIPSLTAELIAQCFLNLPNSINNTSPSGAGSGSNDADSQLSEDDTESVDMVNDAVVSAANVLAALGGISEGT